MNMHLGRMPVTWSSFRRAAQRPSSFFLACFPCSMMTDPNGWADNHDQYFKWCVTQTVSSSHGSRLYLGVQNPPWPLLLLPYANFPAKSITLNNFFNDNCWTRSVNRQPVQNWIEESMNDYTFDLARPSSEILLATIKHCWKFVNNLQTVEDRKGWYILNYIRKLGVLSIGNVISGLWRHLKPEGVAHVTAWRC